MENKIKILALLLVMSSCALFKPSISDDLKKCGTDQVSTVAIVALVPQVAAILASPDGNWASLLAALELKAGSAVICAVQVVMDDLKNGKDPQKEVANMWTIEYPHVAKDVQIARAQQALGR
jgi:hypothetical protein